MRRIEDAGSHWPAAIEDAVIALQALSQDGGEGGFQNIN